MLTHWLQQQTEKLRAQQRAEGVTEGLAIGQAQADARWREWYQQYLDAWYQRQVDKGIVFSKPPPPPPLPPANLDSKE